MGRQTDPMVKTKLYLLGIGILILLVLLVGKGTKPEKPEDTKNPPQAETPAEPEAEEELEPEIPMPEYNGRIRVLLKTQDFAQEVHETVRLTSDRELSVKGSIPGEEGVVQEEYEGGVELSFVWEDGSLLLNGEILADTPSCFVIGPQEEGEGALISVESLSRGNGVPAYEGTLEVWPVEQGFVLVNEVPLETYLNYVVPSEMPSRYEKEALKAQAVCARTYAYKHLQSYGYPEYEAHVDDSVRYQVYNNTGQAESTSQAVAETADLILTSQGQPITAYYFSTSCGYTGNEEIWLEGSAELTPYLQGKMVNESGELLDMTDEETFRAFITDRDDTCYDAPVSWYRWETELDVETLSQNLNQVLKSRYEANPEAVLTKRGTNYVSRPVEDIGTIEEIEVLERSQGGAVHRMRIQGSRQTIEVTTEYNVRALLNPQGVLIHRQDGTTAEGGTLLPSAYLIVTPVYNEEEELTGFHFQGGGYGHGVGMSQNAANTMAGQGKTCQEILQFFYTEVQLTSIPDL